MGHARRLGRRPPDVMLGQLAWLERFLSLGLGHITLGIVPMGVELAIVPTTDFLIVDAQAYVETHTGEVKAGEPDSAKYAEIFDVLKAEALTGDDARRLVMAAADNLQGKQVKQRREPAGGRRTGAGRTPTRTSGPCGPACSAASGSCGTLG